MRTESVIVVLAAALGAGCGATTNPRSLLPAVRASIHVTSDFGPGAVIPRSHTCDGRNLPPPVRAAGLPAGTRELVVVMRDHDAPGGDFIHWAVAHIKPESPAPRRMFLPVAARPTGAVLGLNSFGSLGYRGPCPPPGAAAHRYEVTVYALGRPSGLESGFSAGAVGALPVLGRGSLTGVYARR